MQAMPRPASAVGAFILKGENMFQLFTNVFNAVVSAVASDIGLIISGFFISGILFTFVWRLIRGRY